MDLVAGVKRVVIVMDHMTKNGQPKLLRKCTLPITGAGVVNRVITNLCVLDITASGFYLVEVAPDVNIDEVAKATDAIIHEKTVQGN